MTKLCICKICTCGRHKCPHNTTGLGYGNEPCSFSEYSNKFTQHPIEMQKSCKPEQKAAVSNGPMEDKTTHMMDYVPHAVEKPQFHQSDRYKQPEGDMDMMTNYHKEFTNKPMEKVKPVRQPDQRKRSGKFEGEPTYAADYRKWGVQPREKHVADNDYQPPSAPFDGNTNYQADYITHRAGPPRQSMKPNEPAMMSSEPFDDNTHYRQNYVKHPLQAREMREKPTWHPNDAPLDDLSHYRKDYAPRDAGKKTESCKPDATPYQSNAPFDGDTTQKADYIKWPTERPYHREQERYQKPDGNMDMNTTTQTDYIKKPMERQLPRRPQETRKLTGKFDGTTNYQAEYLKWAPGERPKQAAKEQYVPSEAPFDGTGTYQRDYIAHQVNRTRSLKPADPGYASNAPLDDNTEYKKEFYRKAVSPCPVPMVDAGVHPKYNHSHQDDAGHKWYHYEHAAGSVH